MGSDKRTTRPVLERSRPVRNWSTLFEAPGDDAARGSEPDSAAAGPLGGPALNDVVTRSVDLGYRVIDEYIRQGQKAAQRLNERSYGAQTMAGDVQDLAMRLTQYASDFAAVWLQLVQLAATGSGAASAPASATQPGPGESPTPAVDTGAAVESASHAAAPAARVRIEVRAAQPTEVAVDIRPDATGMPLIAHALRAMDPNLPRLEDVSFVPASDGGAASLRIRVPPGQPPGIYNGMLIEEQTSRPAGTVSVTVLE